MDEYIKKQDAIDLIMSQPTDAHYPSWYVDLVDKISVANATSVVRCKDCKHYVYKYINDEIGDIGGCIVLNRATKNDDFCSFGERKDGVEE